MSQLRWIPQCDCGHDGAVCECPSYDHTCDDICQCDPDNDADHDGDEYG